MMSTVIILALATLFCFLNTIELDIRTWFSKLISKFVSNLQLQLQTKHWWCWCSSKTHVLSISKFVIICHLISATVCKFFVLLSAFCPTFPPRENFWQLEIVLKFNYRGWICSRIIFIELVFPIFVTLIPNKFSNSSILFCLIEVCQIRLKIRHN